MCSSDLGDGRLRRVVQAVYALQALSIALAALGDGVIITTLIVVLPAGLGYGLCRLRRSAAEGTPLEPHIRWQIRSFTVAAISILLATLVLGPLLFLGLTLLWFAYALAGLWLAWRIVRGAWSLWKSRPLPGAAAMIRS